MSGQSIAMLPSAANSGSPRSAVTVKPAFIFMLILPLMYDVMLEEIEREYTFRKENPDFGNNM